MLVACVCMCAYCVLLFFLAIESNEECTEEGEIFDYQEKNKIRDKPTKASHLT
jgi:hypothetical protein